MKWFELLQKVIENNPMYEKYPNEHFGGGWRDIRLMFLCNRPDQSIQYVLLPQRVKAYHTLGIEIGEDVRELLIKSLIDDNYSDNDYDSYSDSNSGSDSDSDERPNFKKYIENSYTTDSFNKYVTDILQNTGNKNVMILTKCIDQEESEKWE
jgi:hypothetical protein